MVRRPLLSRRAEARWLALGLLAATLLLALPGPLASVAAAGAPAARALAPHAGADVQTAPANPINARYGHFRGTLPELNWSAEMARAIRNYGDSDGLLQPFGHHVRRVLPVPGANLYVGGDSLLIVDRNLTVGNVTVAGNGTLAVYNASRSVTLTINGNVHLQDRGIFYVNGSRLVANESFDDELSLSATISSLFLLIGANVSANGHVWPGTFGGDSNLTVIGSSVGYPDSWFPITVQGNATVFLEGSWFLSDLVVQDTAYLPSSSRLTLDGVLGFNIWLGLRQRVHANVSLPGAESFQSWRFPGDLNVSGVNYSVAVNDSFVGFHVLTVAPGSSLALSHTTGVVLALTPMNQVLTFSGLRDGWLNGSYVAGGFNVHLEDTQVASWQLYPYSSVITVNDSQLGEIVTNTGSSATVVGSDLTGVGGFDGAFGASSLDIYGSNLSGDLVAGDQGTILLDRGNDTGGAPRQILSIDNASVRVLDVALGPQVSCSAQGDGTIWVGYTARISVLAPGGPAPSAAVRVLWAGNETLAASAVTQGNGTVLLPLAEEELGPGGTYDLSHYLVDAALGASGGSSPLTVDGPTGTAVELVPLVASTSPANGSAGVGLAPAVELEFGLTMDPAPTEAALSIVPAAAWSAAWAPNDSALSLHLSGLRAATTYHLTVGTGALTQTGIAFPAPSVLVFTTLFVPTPPPAPTLLAALPVGGAVGVSPGQNITLTFDEAMDPASVAASLSVSPAFAPATLNVSGSVVRWSHTVPLPPDTTFTLVIGAGARAADGTSLGHALSITFTTGGIVAPTRPGGAVGPASAGALSATTELAISVLLSATIVGTALLLASRRRRPPPPIFLPAPPAWLEVPPEGPRAP
jgi:hypothetical protein